MLVSLNEAHSMCQWGKCKRVCVCVCTCTFLSIIAICVFVGILYRHISRFAQSSKQSCGSSVSVPAMLRVYGAVVQKPQNFRVSSEMASRLISLHLKRLKTWHEKPVLFPFISVLWWEGVSLCSLGISVRTWTYKSVFVYLLRKLLFSERFMFLTPNPI